MLKELQPVLTRTTLVLTLALTDGQLRMTVVPKPKKDATDEEKKLYQPLSITGTLEELEAELPEALRQYSATFASVTDSVKEAQKQMKEAADAIKAKADEKKKEAKSKGATPAKPKPQTANMFEGVEPTDGDEQTDDKEDGNGD